MKSSKKHILLNAAGAAVCIIAVFLIIILVISNGKPVAKKVTIGVVNLTPALRSVFEGIKEGLAEFGYVENENVTYIYEDVGGKIPLLDQAIQKVMQAGVDLIFSLSTPATQKVRQITAGSNVPIVFAPVNDPVAAKIVKSMRQPGGSLTGIKASGFVAKGLEWLKRVAPQTTRVLVPHNPNDRSSILGLGELREAATLLGLEIMAHPVRSMEALDNLIARIPEETDTIFILPDNMVISRVAVFGDKALRRGLKLFSVSLSEGQAGVLASCGPDFFSIGKQAARLANQILGGISPSEIPVETAEFIFTINMRTAKAIGLDIPIGVLQQADKIIR